MTNYRESPYVDKKLIEPGEGERTSVVDGELESGEGG
jgi:hypothetical protein